MTIQCKKFLISDMALLIYIAIATTVCHLLVSGNYGYFLDEFYTLACSRHLSMIFVDIPPVAPMLLALNTAVFGDSLIALHILPSLFGGGIVMVTGLMAKELGGGKFAVVLSAISAALVPVWMAVASFYTYDFLDQFVIASLFYTVILLLKRENLKIWLVIGAIAGIGLMTKPSMIFFIAAIGIALLITKNRKMLLTPWPWLGTLIAFVIIMPALILQVQNHFPIAEYWVAYSGSKTVNASPLEFMLMQVIGINFFLLPIWGTGLYYFLFNKEDKRYRLLGVTYILLFFMFMATGAKLYMLAPAYAMLLAAGSVVFEKHALKKRGKIIVSVYTCLIIITGIIQAPNYMPILSVEGLEKYYDIIGGLTGTKLVKLDNKARTELPEYFTNRMEWDVLLRDVSTVYESLTPEERQDTVIVTQNYGWAGAIDQLGGEWGLPKAMCGQLNYYFFSLDNINKKTWIMIGESQDGLSQVFGNVVMARMSTTKYRQPYEIPIFICKEPKFTSEEAKVGIKRFN